MQKYVLTRIISFLFFLCMVVFLFFITGFKTSALGFTNDYSGRKIASIIDLNSEFDTKSINLVLKPSESQYRGISDSIMEKLCSIDEVESVVELINVPDNLLVDDKTLKSSDSEIIRHLKQIDYKQILKIVLNTDTKEEVINVVHKIELFDEVLYVGPNYYCEPTSVSTDDTRYSEQWALHGTNGIDANEAWEVTTGSSGIRVGIIDSGIALHEDLNANLVSGYDYYNNNSITTDVDGSHGTNVAGIIGAVGDNDRGIAGINFHVSLVPMQVSYIDSKVWFSVEAIVNAIDAAGDLWDGSNRISILNYSGSGFGNNPTILAAIERFPGLFVWSAGNDGINVDDYSDIDDYSLNNLISVGAHDINGNRSIWSTDKSSNYGEAVNIYAPGGASHTSDNCLTTTSTSSTAYDYFSGTSCAAPHVSGVAALLLSLNNNLSASQLKTIILESAETINISIPNGDSTTSQNVLKLNADNAVQYAIENYLTTNSNVALYCYSKYKSSTQNCDVGNSVFYKFNINCAKSYTFVSNASYPINMTLYDDNFDIINTITPTMTNSNCTGTITEFFNPGTYYLKINYVSDSDSGNITTSYKATWPSNGEQLILNTNINIRTHLHLTTNNNYHSLAYYNNTSGAGYYKITLTANANSSYPSGAIKVYEDSNRQYLIDRYDVSGMTSPASSHYGENVMYIFLPDTCTYYFEITMPYNSYVSLNLKIEKSEINNFDYTNTLIYQTYNVLFENKSTYSYFEEVTISHRSKFQLDISTLNVGMDTIQIYIFKKESITGYNPNDRYYCTKVSSSNWFIAIDNTSPYYTFVLEAGTYYFGYTSNDYGASINYALKRVVDYDASSLGTLITDPALNQGYTLGSEVNFNGGLPQDTTITEGFTRCIYLMFGNFIELPDSRLDYDWYSSNDSVASVTHYGTVLGKPVNTNTNVKIYAVLKEDPSVVFSIELTILDDTETDEIEIISNLSYSYSTENGIYQLELDNSNCPYPWINYYIWDIEIPTTYPNLEVEMNQWGYITSNGTGEAIITGNYLLNSRITLIINLTITN